MKFLLTILLTTLMSLTTNAQKAYTTSKDEETGSPVFKGPITFADLRAEPAFTWLKRGEASYNPDSAAIDFLRTELPAYRLVAVMGTWCDDSHNLIPRLSRVLDAARFPQQNLKMIGVDRSKQVDAPESKIYDVKRVPTIIIYKENKEVGRIVETVHKSIEQDLEKILRGKE